MLLLAWEARLSLCNRGQTRSKRLGCLFSFLIYKRLSSTEPQSIPKTQNISRTEEVVQSQIMFPAVPAVSRSTSCCDNNSVFQGDELATLNKAEMEMSWSPTLWLLNQPGMNTSNINSVLCCMVVGIFLEQRALSNEYTTNSKDPDRP